MSFWGAVFIFAVLLLRAMFLHRLPKTAFLLLWGIALLRLLIPASFPLPFGGRLSTGGIPALPSLQNNIANFTDRLLKNPPDAVGNAATLDLKAHASPILLLQILWLAGAMVVAGFFMVSYLRCKREFCTALPVQNDFSARWLSLHPLRRTIKIRQLTGLSTPLTYGIFHPVILMPKHTDWGKERHLQYILFHEYVHIRRFDAVSKLLAAAALCLHWFNPLVWVMYVLFNRDLELSCDEHVIRHFGAQDRKTYATALLSMEARKNTSVPFGNYFNKNATQERITAIMKYKKKTIFSLALAAAIIAIGAVAAFAIVPRTKSADFGTVLKGDAPFFYVSGDYTEQKYISDIPALFDPEDDFIKIWSFAVLDLNGDGEDEVVLSVYGAAGDMGGKFILHALDGKIYGYIARAHSMEELKADGTFYALSPANGREGGIYSITRFTTTGYHVEPITYGQGTNGVWDSFVVEHQPATEEEYLAAQNVWAGKADAVWYDFDAEGIIQGFPSNL